MITIHDLTGIITGTGTTGDTIILGGGTTTGGTHLIIIIGIILLVIMAHLLDRKLNLKMFQDLESYREFCQNQNNQELE